MNDGKEIYNDVSDVFDGQCWIWVYTEMQIKVCMWLREISFCSSLTVLPGPAWVLLSKTYKPLFPPL